MATTVYVDTNCSGTHDGTSGNPYATLAAAIAGQTGASLPLTILCRNTLGQADTTKVDIDGYTTGSGTGIIIQADTGHRHAGVWADAKYRLEVSDDYCAVLREDYIAFDGIQFAVTNPSAARKFFLNVGRSSGGLVFANCIFKGHGNASYGLQFHGISTGDFTPVTIYNCLAYNWGANNASHFYPGSGTWNFYNCTVIMSASADRSIMNEGGTVACYNTYASGGSYGAFGGTFSGDHNASFDTSAVTKFGETSINSVAVNTTNFTNVTGGSENFALPLGSGLIGVGTDNPGSGLYSTDIAGRSRTSTWDIGAFEYAATAQFARPSSDVAGGTFRSILVTAPFGPRVIA